MGSTGHNISWDDVREGTLTELEVGSTFVKPGIGTAYYISKDKQTITGVGWQELDGVAWTVTSLADGRITVRSHDGQERDQELPTNPDNINLLIKK